LFVFREQRLPFHPRTPELTRKFSRRAWDGLIRQWRLNLHCWSEFPVSAVEQLDTKDGNNRMDKDIPDWHNVSFSSDATTGSTEMEGV